jgi:hypothetical protein
MARKGSEWSGTAYEIAISAGAGGLTGGPFVAAAAGGAAAIKEAVRLVRSDSFGGPGLARLQESRLTEAIEQAARSVQALAVGGYTPRNDWFEPADDSVKASFSGIELLEGTLIAAANEFERRKVKLVANLWAQLAYNPSVSFETCVFLLKTTNELSYQELVILATLTELAGAPPDADDATLDVAVAEGDALEPLQGEHSNHSFRGSGTLASQVLDLIRRDVVRQDRGNQVPSNTQQVRPWACAPTLTGRRLYVLTGMRRYVPFDDKRSLAEKLTEHS